MQCARSANVLPFERHSAGDGWAPSEWCLCSSAFAVLLQKYEIVKTEDLPNFPEGKFSPELIRDVAQNILSFLKTRATKEGHTYWLFSRLDFRRLLPLLNALTSIVLFAEEGSDVVKLYDLSCLCEEYMNDKDANPFTLPVAILMYRVARNLMRPSVQKRTRKVANTVYRLLNNCLDLLTRDKYPQVLVVIVTMQSIIGSNYMLTSRWLPQCIVCWRIFICRMVAKVFPVCRVMMHHLLITIAPSTIGQLMKTGRKSVEEMPVPLFLSVGHTLIDDCNCWANTF